MIRRFFGRKKADIINIIVFVIVIGFSLLTGFMQLFSLYEFDDKIILSAILVVVGFLSGSQLMERYGILERLSEGKFGGSPHAVVLRGRAEVEDAHPLEDRFARATRICIACSSGAALLKGTPVTHMHAALARGVTIEMLTIKPDSEAAREHLANKIKHYIRDVSDTMSPIHETPRFVTQYRTENPELYKNFHHKMTDINLPYSLMLIYSGNKLTFLKVDLYTVGVDDKDRRSFVVEPHQNELRLFFEHEWNMMWNKNEEAKHA